MMRCRAPHYMMRVESNTSEWRMNEPETAGRHEAEAQPSLHSCCSAASLLWTEATNPYCLRMINGIFFWLQFTDHDIEQFDQASPTMPCILLVFNQLTMAMVGNYFSLTCFAVLG